MNESGVIQQPAIMSPPSPKIVPPSESALQVDFLPKSTAVPNTNSRYRRLAESRSITPSPTPLMKDVMENGPAVARGTTLSPIASSPDSSPVTTAAKRSPFKPKLLSVPVPSFLSSAVSRKHKNGNLIVS